MDATDAQAAGVQVTVTVPWSSGSTTVVLSDVSGALPTLGAGPATNQTSTQRIVPAGANKGTISFTIPKFQDGDAYGVKVTHSAS